MNNWKKFALLTVLVAASGYVFIGRAGNNMPSDMRDAVSDSDAAGGTGTENPALAVQKPVAEAAEDVNSGAEKIQAAFDALKSDTGAAGDTPYEILAGLFKKGQPAEAADVTGWYYTLVARSPETAFFGISGGTLVEDTESDYQKVRQLHFIYHEDFDLDTPVSAKMLEPLNTAIKDSPVVVKFPPGVWTRDTPSGRHKVAYKKNGNYVIVKNSGPGIKDAQPPFDCPVFYACFVKKAAAAGDADR